MPTPNDPTSAGLQLINAGVSIDHRALDFEHDIGPGQRRLSIGGDRGTGSGERGVTEMGAVAGPGFRGDFEAHAYHPLDGIRRCGHPALECPPFLDHGDLHGPAVPDQRSEDAPHNAACAAICEELTPSGGRHEGKRPVVVLSPQSDRVIACHMRQYP